MRFVLKLLKKYFYNKYVLLGMILLVTFIAGYAYKSEVSKPDLHRLWQGPERNQRKYPETDAGLRVGGCPPTGIVQCAPLSPAGRP